MYKRLIYISLLNWLVIALAVSFPTAKFFTNNSNANRLGRKTEVVIPPSATHTISEDEPEEPVAPSEKNCRKHHRVRFLVSRTADLNAVYPGNTVAIPGIICSRIAHLFARYEVRKATLPSYYGFLFRLSPF